jgi:hypothetical protein
MASLETDSDFSSFELSPVINPFFEASDYLNDFVLASPFG